MTRAHIGLAAIILFEILILFIGCQGDSHNPLAPGITPDQPTTEIQSSGAAKAYSPPLLWGLYTVAYDSATHEITAAPQRGPSFALNVVKFLQPPAGSLSGMTIGVLDDSSFVTDGRVDVRIILHHPFPGQPGYTGFDVCGIFMTERSQQSDYDWALWYADPTLDPSLLNPDGYTRWMNPEEFLGGDIWGYEPGFWGTSESSENSGFVAGATLNPYKYFASGLGPTDQIYDWLSDPSSIAGRGIFPSGASCSRDYELQFPIVGDSHVFIFNYAVLANWAEPTVHPPVNPVTDFPPEANANWPIHVSATDTSNAYYTEDESGGTIGFDIEIFDWNGINNPAGIPGEIGRIAIWSDEQLIAGQYGDTMSTEVEWNSGFLASTSVATVEFPADPTAPGQFPVWIEIQSAPPSSYNQGFGVPVPTDPISTYLSVMVDVKTCPKAGAGEIEGGYAGSGDYLDDVIISGENFVAGPELGFWLELGEAGGEAGDTEPYQIQATDIQYLNDNSVSVDFNLQDAPFGDYGLGCINGCGVVTEAKEQPILKPLKMFKINITKPINIELTTNRKGPEAEPLQYITISWSTVPDAQYYRVYAKFYDVNGNPIGGSSIIGTAAYPQHTLNLDYLPNGASGIVEFWITALPGLDENNLPYESDESTHAFTFMQNFETGLGHWQTAADDTAMWRFIRSTVDCVYDGSWGLKSFGSPTGPRWMILTAPPINDLAGADTVEFEFVHRHYNVGEMNGYQAGWLYSVPEDGSPEVTNWYPLPSVSYGEPYNDTDAYALQEELGCNQYNDNNWQSIEGEWTPWYLSGFDASEILGDALANNVGIGLAYVSGSKPGICIDDVAVLIY